jgi:hypothetical protein
MQCSQKTHSSYVNVATVWYYCVLGPAFPPPPPLVPVLRAASGLTRVFGILPLYF